MGVLGTLVLGGPFLTLGVSAFLLSPTVSSVSSRRRAPSSSDSTSLRITFKNNPYGDDPREWPGATAPFGFFDPLGFSKNPDGSWKTLELKRYRESEIKHGRLAMLAALGYFVAEFYHPLVYESSERALTQWEEAKDVISGFEGIIFAFAGVIEGYNIALSWESQIPQGNLREGVPPGDILFDPLELAKEKSEEELKDLCSKELNNGRLAMFAIVGMIGYSKLVNPDGRIWDTVPDNPIKEFWETCATLPGWYPEISF
uniref:Uncharacterized protein n=1 Tax=Chromera velia CCMP2878 TaxID=1169474 RepID=A0A0G4HRW2_9ALVE|mmetsp:Transcript_53454/g.104566  ORF Transcript_53454/g.104566 Transcript_53454/m.104566 type:complete len:258 (+) Transcript_53454:185-958(+)|eukprot:Cvel_30835.t1-p1 / transcript=Cvel_30835.t1 / gene=Cvel_30835 / organism=Chromera_velia_CCMP2878 / gene_product=Fucoxanthin-chlorophyll a-c binding protein,, putative / transcript_product=Fucoxanthin-chlorophyll a-c binding protein,, putative / location=Cvel_scaffold4477:2674-5063(+) / protein_length=257 / sequence_SO=supercontig / SO=protein_coding / is_pseudo=false